ncbi:glycosyltransferase family 39 protein [Candidatus Woesearchaeota archaeon]|nr:glycosyltransferase family 39 protein [Candidatus Woesearchaeota archaeon]
MEGTQYPTDAQAGTDSQPPHSPASTSKLPAILLIVGLLAVFALYQYNIGFEETYDGAVHDSQGFFFYDYFRSLLHGNFITVPAYFAEYAQKYTMGWAVLFHPPAHAMFQGLFFLFLGQSVYIGKLTTMVLTLLGAILLYKLASELLNDKWLGVATAVLYVLFPYNYSFARTAFLEIPLSMAMVGWFYFFFKEGKKISLNLGIVSLKLSIPLLLSTFFMAIAGYMKYHSPIFATLFIILLTIFTLIREWPKHPHATPTDNWRFLKQTKITSWWAKLVFQGIVFLLIGGWWLQFSLFDNGMYERIRYEGVGKDFEWGFEQDWPFTPSESSFWAYRYTYHAFSAVYKSGWLGIFAMLPLLLLALNKKYREKNRSMVNAAVFILAVWLFATFAMTNKQLRYAIHAYPLFAMFAVMGIRDIGEWIKAHFGFRHFALSIIVLAIPWLAFLDKAEADRQLNEYGHENNEVFDYIAKTPEPRFIVNINQFPYVGAGYYNSPELLLFKSLQLKSGYDPATFQQAFQYVYWQSLNDVPGFIKQLAGIPVPVFVIIYHPNKEPLEQVDPLFKSAGFIRKDIFTYVLYQKGGIQ